MQRAPNSQQQEPQRNPYVKKRPSGARHRRLCRGGSLQQPGGSLQQRRASPCSERCTVGLLVVLLVVLLLPALLASMPRSYSVAVVRSTGHINCTLGVNYGCVAASHYAPRMWAMRGCQAWFLCDKQRVQCGGKGGASPLQICPCSAVALLPPPPPPPRACPTPARPAFRSAVFIHLAHTGGTTLNQFFVDTCAGNRLVCENMFSPARLVPSVRTVETKAGMGGRLDVLYGHYGFNTSRLDLVMKRPYFVVVLLRDPYEIARSSYFHMLANARNEEQKARLRALNRTKPAKTAPTRAILHMSPDEWLRRPEGSTTVMTNVGRLLGGWGAEMTRRLFARPHECEALALQQLQRVDAVSESRFLDLGFEKYLEATLKASMPGLVWHWNHDVLVDGHPTALGRTAVGTNRNPIRTIFDPGGRFEANVSDDTLAHFREQNQCAYRLLEGARKLPTFWAPPCYDPNARGGGACLVCDGPAEADRQRECLSPS